MFSTRSSPVSPSSSPSAAGQEPRHSSSSSPALGSTTSANSATSALSSVSVASGQHRPSASSAASAGPSSSPRLDRPRFRLPRPRSRSNKSDTDVPRSNTLTAVPAANAAAATTTATATATARLSTSSGHNPPSSTTQTSVPSIDTPSGSIRNIRDVLAPFAVPVGDIEERHPSLLQLVRALIGVVPNADSILEIFPPAFTTYNLVVPNFLNMPFVLWGVAAPPELVSLAMYYSARSSQCAYCSLHCCTFALRRGVDEQALSGSRAFSAREAAVIDAALNMSSFPSHLVEDDRHNLYRHLSAGSVEWVVLAIAMMGFLTTFMNSVGVDMESAAVEEAAELLSASGWSAGKHDITQPQTESQQPQRRPQRSDTFLSNFLMLKHLPPALSYDMNATRNIPKAWPAIGNFLLRTVGHSFPILGLITHTRAARAIAEVIRLNLDAIVCGIEPDIKYLIGVVFAGVHCNRLMTKEFRKMTMLMVDYLDDDAVEAVFEFSKEETDFSVDFQNALADSALMDTPLSESQVRLLYVAKACCFAPTRTTQAVVNATKGIPPEQTVELICWVSVLSMLQKLYIFYYPSCGEKLTAVEAQFGVRAPLLTKLPAAHIE